MLHIRFWTGTMHYIQHDPKSIILRGDLSFKGLQKELVLGCHTGSHYCNAAYPVRMTYWPLASLLLIHHLVNVAGKVAKDVSHPCAPAHAGGSVGWSSCLLLVWSRSSYCYHLGENNGYKTLSLSLSLSWIHTLSLFPTTLPLSVSGKSSAFQISKPYYFFLSREVVAEEALISLLYCLILPLSFKQEAD